MYTKELKDVINYVSIIINITIYLLLSKAKLRKNNIQNFQMKTSKWMFISLRGSLRYLRKAHLFKQQSILRLFKTY